MNTAMARISCTLLSTLLCLVLALSSTTVSAQTIPWSPAVSCDGPSGQAVLDEFVFTYYGNPVFQQQLVIRNESINAWLYSQGAVALEIAARYPQELIVPLVRLSPNDHAPLASRYQNTLGAFTYVLEVQIPVLTLRVLSRETGREVANWSFRECSRHPRRV